MRAKRCHINDFMYYNNGKYSMPSDSNRDLETGREILFYIENNNWPSQKLNRSNVSAWQHQAEIVLRVCNNSIGLSTWLYTAQPHDTECVWVLWWKITEGSSSVSTQQSSSKRNSIELKLHICLHYSISYGWFDGRILLQIYCHESKTIPISIPTLHSHKKKHWLSSFT